MEKNLETRAGWRELAFAAAVYGAGIGAVIAALALLAAVLAGLIG